MAERCKLQQSVKMAEKFQKHTTQIDELNQVIKQTKDKKTLAALKSELKGLIEKHPIQSDNTTISTLESLSAECDSIATELYHKLLAKENMLMGEDNLEASMLCEVDRMTLLNILKVFELDICLEDDRETQKGYRNENALKFQNEHHSLQETLLKMVSILLYLDFQFF